MALDPSGFYVWPRLGGGPTKINGNGEAFGAVGPYMMGVDYDFDGDIFFGVPVKRYLGASGEEVTGLPDQLINGVPEDPFHTYAGVAFHQTSRTAILGAFSKAPGEGSPNMAHLYRSTDEGASWTEVHTWDPGLAFKGDPMSIAYNGQTVGSWWVNGAIEGANLGLWHSTDDGLTWTFVDISSVYEGFQMPALSSAGRAGRSPR